MRFLQVRSEPASASEITQGLHLKKSDSRPLFRMLAKLKKRGAIEELPGGRYRLPGRKAEQKASGKGARPNGGGGKISSIKSQQGDPSASSKPNP